MTKAISPLDLSVFEKNKQCVVARWTTDELDEEQSAVFDAALASRYSAHTIFEWLVSLGMTDYTEQTTWRHRVGRCGCRPRRNYLEESA